MSPSYQCASAGADSRSSQSAMFTDKCVRCNVAVLSDDITFCITCHKCYHKQCASDFCLPNGVVSWCATVNNIYNSKNTDINKSLTESHRISPLHNISSANLKNCSFGSCRVSDIHLPLYSCNLCSTYLHLDCADASKCKISYVSKYFVITCHTCLAAKNELDTGVLNDAE